MTPAPRAVLDRTCLAREAVLICCSARSVDDVSRAYPGQRVLYVGTEPITEQVQVFRDTEALRQGFTVATWRSPNVVMFDASPEQRADIEQMVHVTTANRTAAYDRGRDWVTNLIANLPRLSECAPAAAARGCLRGVPALLVGPGPSLDRNIDEIERFRGRALIVGCNSATRAVRCDVSVCVESHDLRHKLDPEAPVACLSLTSPASTWEHATGLRAAVANGELGRVVADLTGTRTVDSSGSVSTSALSLLELWGCSPIVLVGHDLALADDGRNYCGAVGGGAAPDAERTTVLAWGGSGVVDSVPLYDGVRGFFAGRGGAGRVNATEGGSRIPGWEERTLKREGDLQRRILVWRESGLLSRPPDMPPIDQLAAALRAIPPTTPDHLRAFVADQIDRLETLALVACHERGGLLLAEVLSHCALLEPWVAREVLELARARWSEPVGDREPEVAIEHAEVLAGILARGAVELSELMRSVEI